MDRETHKALTQVMLALQDIKWLLQTNGAPVGQLDTAIQELNRTLQKVPRE